MLIEAKFINRADAKKAFLSLLQAIGKAKKAQMLFEAAVVDTTLTQAMTLLEKTRTRLVAAGLGDDPLAQDITALLDGSGDPERLKQAGQDK